MPVYYQSVLQALQRAIGDRSTTSTPEKEYERLQDEMWKAQVCNSHHKDDLTVLILP